MSDEEAVVEVLGTMSRLAGGSTDVLVDIEHLTAELPSLPKEQIIRAVNQAHAEGLVKVLTSSVKLTPVGLQRGANR